MTDKIQELRRIQQMIVDGAVADEINARVWCASTKLNLVKWENYKNTGCWEFVRVNNKGSSRGFIAISGDNSREEYVFETPYMQSLDAIKGLESDDYWLEIHHYDNGFKVIATHKKTGKKTITPPLPKEQAARLYAVLETWIYDLTEGEK